MTGDIEPASLVAPDRIDDEGVIVLPTSDRVSVPPRVRRVGGSPAYVFGKLSSVGPDFAPYSVELKEFERLARHLRESNSSHLIKRGARET